MIVTYIPSKEGKISAKKELKKLKNLETNFTSFSLDEPELTKELISKMKSRKKNKAN